MTAVSLGEQIVAEARALIGTKFYHTGRDEHGLDCAGLILACWHRLHLTDWDDRRYAPGGDVTRQRAGLERFCDRIDIEAGLAIYEASGPPLIQPGDVLLLAIRRLPIHVAIATGDGGMIHALQDVGRVVEVPLDEHWRKRVVGVWRWREAADQ